MNHLANLPAIIKELIENNIEVILTKEGYKIGGFYKSGTILLLPQEGDVFIAVDRYGEKDDIDDLERLVGLNFSWWIKQHQTNPDPNWLPLLEKFNYVKVKQVTTTVVEPLNWRG
jgi:hypothetical protein